MGRQAFGEAIITARNWCIGFVVARAAIVNATMVSACPLASRRSFSSATQGGGKAGVAGINSFGQGLLERGECVFKCLAEGPAPPIGKRHEALNHLGRRLDV